MDTAAAVSEHESAQETRRYDPKDLRHLTFNGKAWTSIDNPVAGARIFPLRNEEGETIALNLTLEEKVTNRKLPHCVLATTIKGGKGDVLFRYYVHRKTGPDLLVLSSVDLNETGKDWSKHSSTVPDKTLFSEGEIDLDNATKFNGGDSLRARLERIAIKLNGDSAYLARWSSAIIESIAKGTQVDFKTFIVPKKEGKEKEVSKDYTEITAANVFLRLARRLCPTKGDSLSQTVKNVANDDMIVLNTSNIGMSEPAKSGLDKDDRVKDNKDVDGIAENNGDIIENLREVLAYIESDRNKPGRQNGTLEIKNVLGNGKADHSSKIDEKLLEQIKSGEFSKESIRNLIFNVIDEGSKVRRKLAEFEVDMDDRYIALSEEAEKSKEEYILRRKARLDPDFEQLLRDEEVQRTNKVRAKRNAGEAVNVTNVGNTASKDNEFSDTESRNSSYHTCDDSSLTTRDTSGNTTFNSLKRLLQTFDKEKDEKTVEDQNKSSEVASSDSFMFEKVTKEEMKNLAIVKISEVGEILKLMLRVKQDTSGYAELISNALELILEAFVEVVSLVEGIDDERNQLKEQVKTLQASIGQTIHDIWSVNFENYSESVTGNSSSKASSAGSGSIQPNSSMVNSESMKDDNETIGATRQLLSLFGTQHLSAYMECLVPTEQLMENVAYVDQRIQNIVQQFLAEVLKLGLKKEVATRYLNLLNKGKAREVLSDLLALDDDDIGRTKLKQLHQLLDYCLYDGPKSGDNPDTVFSKVENMIVKLKSGIADEKAVLPDLVTDYALMQAIKYPGSGLKLAIAMQERQKTLKGHLIDGTGYKSNLLETINDMKTDLNANSVQLKGSQQPASPEQLGIYETERIGFTNSGVKEGQVEGKSNHSRKNMVQATYPRRERICYPYAVSVIGGAAAGGMKCVYGENCGSLHVAPGSINMICPEFKRTSNCNKWDYGRDGKTVVNLCPYLHKQPERFGAVAVEVDDESVTEFNGDTRPIRGRRDSGDGMTIPHNQ